MEKQPLLNTYVNNLSMNEAIDCVEQMIITNKKSYVASINVDVVIKIEEDNYLKSIINEADMVLVDGKPLVWIAKWMKRPVKEKISGSDFVPQLCQTIASKGYTFFIIGGKEGIGEKAKNNLEKEIPNIRIVGTYAPPLGFENDDEEVARINAMINEVHPDILIVCFGCPKQEKWIYENYQKYNATVSIIAGATVDFLAGNVKRAPKWMSDYGLEWFYRFLCEPRRLFKRYFIDDMKIFRLALKYKAKR